MTVLRRLPKTFYQMLTRKKQRFVEEEEKKQDNDGDAADAAEDLNARERFRVFTRDVRKPNFGSVSVYNKKLS